MTIMCKCHLIFNDKKSIPYAYLLTRFSKRFENDDVKCIIMNDTYKCHLIFNEKKSIPYAHLLTRFSKYFENELNGKQNKKRTESSSPTTKTSSSTTKTKTKTETTPILTAT